MRPLPTIQRGARKARERMAAALSCLLLVMSQLFGCLSPLAAPAVANAATLPDVIHATTDKDAFASSSMPTLTGDIHNLGGTNPVTGQDYLSYATAWRTQEGLMGYCVSTLNNHHTPADGDWLTYRKNRLMDPELAYILRHGYPFTNVIGGVSFSDADARLVTQFAFWLITDEDFNADSGNPWKTGTAVPAARRLVADARAHGAEEARRNQFWVYTTSDGDNYQDLVLGVDSTGGLRIVKKSSDEAVSGGNPCYDLTGAVYGLYEDEGCAREAARLVTDASGSAEAHDLLAGTYYLKELSPAKGYALDGRVHRVEVPGGDMATVDVSDAPQICPVELAVEKLDAETGEAAAQGAGTLEGAEFRIDFYKGIHAAGSLPSSPDESWSVTTDAQGKARLNRSLPLGTVAVTETKAPRGYLLDEETKVVHVTGEGAAPTVHTYLAPVAKDLPVRGDVSFVKADEDSQRRMAGVAFRVTSAATGESHIAVTDENGCFDSSAYSAAERTNANDAAVDAEGRVDASKLDASAGIWFGEADPAEGRGSLLYGTYALEELRCPANEGHRLISDSFTVSRDARTIGLGTFDDKEVAIRTTLTYGGSGKACPATGEVELVDEVAFENLERGHAYALEGELHLVGEDGDEGIVSTARVEFAPRLSCGTQPVSFKLDASALGGKKLVAFERLLDGDDVLATHEDLGDEGQTVSVPQIRTALMGDAGKEACSSGGVIRLTDAVRYRGLEPGTPYELEGTLRLKSSDGGDDGPVTGADGEPVRAASTFIPEEPEGTVEVAFEFEDPGLAGRDVVAFEELRHAGVSYAVHADIADEGQTVSFPRIATTATSDDCGGHIAPSGEEIKLTDAVQVDNVVPGTEYVLKGAVHVRGRGGQDEGVVAEADLVFTAALESGLQSIGFSVDDASGLEGKTLVVFEELYRDGTLVASHANIDDEGQSVQVPAIGTTLAAADGAKEVLIENPSEETRVELEDTVEYVNLVPGLQYRLKGRLVGKDGNQTLATAESTFIPAAACGYEKVTFNVGAAEAEGCSVALEELFLDDVKMAAHEDMEDEGQTMRVTRKPAVPQTPQSPQAPLPTTGDASLPTAAIVFLGALLAFTAWAIVRGGSMGCEEDC